MLETHQAKTLNSGNKQINFILLWGIVTLLCGHHFQPRRSSTTVPHATWHQAHNKALLQPKDIRVMGHCGVHMISPKEVLVELKCSSHSNSQDMSHQSQVNLECLLHRLEAIKWFSWHLLSPLHQDNDLRAPRRPPIGLSLKWFQTAAEPRRTDVAGIADLPPIPDISYDQKNADSESDNSSDMGGAKDQAPISLKQTEFSFKQYAKRMGQPNFSIFNQWKKVWVAAFLEKKHWSIDCGQNNFTRLRDGTLHWVTAIAECFDNFETCLY